MNIGIFFGDYSPDLGGSYTFQANLVDALKSAETNHNFFVFHTGDRGRETSGKVRYVSVSSNPGKTVNFIRRSLNLLKNNKSEAVESLKKAIIRYRIDMIWFVTHASESVDIPFICTVLDLEHRVHPFFPEVSVSGSLWDDRDQFFSTMIPRAAYVISGTEAGKQQIIDYYRPNPERVRVIPFPVSQFATEQKEITSDILQRNTISEPYLFYPAQFWPHKNHIILLRALKLLNERHQLDMKLVFCGSDKGNLSYVKKAAYELGIEANVYFLGFVPLEDLYSLYKNAFALVFPSFFGPDNLPPLEAFAIGCPVIAANVAGSIEQFGDAALLVNPLLEEEIVRAVIRLDVEPDLRQFLTVRGKARVKHLTSHNYIIKIAEICDEFELYRRCWSKEERYIHL